MVLYNSEWKFISMINTQAYCIRVDRRREKKLSTIKKNKGTL